jgi:hypothetical protein
MAGHNGLRNFSRFADERIHAGFLGEGCCAVGRAIPDSPIDLTVTLTQRLKSTGRGHNDLSGFSLPLEGENIHSGFGFSPR